MENNLAGLQPALRRIAPFAVAAFLIAAPALSHAANNCAWINESTASGLLGGDAVGVLTDSPSPGQPTVCTFTQDDAGIKRTLRITVEIAPDPHTRLAAVSQACGTDAAPLKAIGNEAMVCTADDRKTGPGERVVGRVRDQVFTITLSTSLKSDPILTREALKTRIYTAAEQVAGNLF
jgi:hypothetical protein